MKKFSVTNIRPHLLPVLLLMAAAFAIYAGTLGHEFLVDWDDNKYVTGNEAVRGLTPEHLKAAFTSFYVGNYAPLHIVSYMLDYSLWGMKPAGFLFANILLHALNGLLYYLLLIRITGRRIWAFLAAFVFLAHPVQVESVAWISQRKNVLAMFFFLISFLLYIRYRDQGPGNRDQENNKPEAGSGTQNSKLKTRNLFYAGSLAAFILALLAKSAAVVLPPVLLAYDICFREKKERRSWLVDKIPYLVAAAVIALVALKSQTPEFGGGRVGYHGGSPINTFLTMLPVFVQYLKLLFWPVDLSGLYSPQIKTAVDVAVILSGLLLAALGGALFLVYRLRKALFFWSLVFIAGLLPVSQIVPLITLINDRYLYFPMLGAAAFIAGAMVLGLDKLALSQRKAVVAVVCLPLMVLPVLSHQRAEVWRDSETFWSHIVKKFPNNTIAGFSLGSAYDRAGRLSDALGLYQRVLSLEPGHRDALNNIANLYFKTGEIERARPYLERLVRQHPDFAGGHRLAGYYHFKKQSLEAAEAAFRKSLAIEPDSELAQRYLGNVLLARGEMEAARELYLKVMGSGGGSPEMYYNLAYLEASSGRSENVLKYLEIAMKSGFKDRNAIVANPAFAHLRNKPDFQMFIQKHFVTE